MTHLIATLLIAFALTPTPDHARTIVRLGDKLMAPCCYSQTIRVHMSAEAEQMREEVTDMVLAGRSEQDIIKYYKAKYGETILVVPDGKVGQIAYGVPIIVALSAFGLLTLVPLHLTPAQNGQQMVELCRAGIGKLGDDDELAELEAGSDDLLAELSQVVLVSTADFADQPVQTEAFEQARHLAGVFAG
jgi:cytochrome c-type biogenesis protein CcmH/NrfF